MASGMRGFAHTFLSFSVLAVLAGCGGPGVTQNALPSGSSSGNQPISGGNGAVSNPGGSTTTPPPTNNLIGDPANAVANMAVLTTTRTTVYNLNTALLGTSGWRPAALLEHNNNATASSPRVAFDTAGNGFAVWTLSSDVFVSRYTASTATWSSPVVIDDGIDGARQARLAIDRQSGNAIATWIQSDGVAQSLYASRFNASTNSWSSPQLVENSNGTVDAESDNVSVSIAGSRGAIAWRQHDGTADSIYLSRLVNGSWTTPALIDTNNQYPLYPEVATDSNGNATATWLQFDPIAGERRVYARRWDNTAQTLGSVLQLSTQGDQLPRLQFDAQGNGFAIWGGGGIYVRRFDVATNQWSNQISIHNNTGSPRMNDLAVDAAGNAIAVWVESDGVADSVYARRYNAAAGTWGNAELLENSAVPVSTEHEPTVSLSGNEAVVAWILDNPTKDVYGIKLSAGVWGAVTSLETRNEPAEELTSSIDVSGNAAVVWVQSDGVARSIHQAQYLSSNVVVPPGGTWQSLANTLYGVNSVEAGNALQAAMGGGPLVAGMILSGFPATLSVTATIPGYYTVLATDTWSHIAQTVYGITDVAAINQLRTLLGNPTLAAGLQLTVPVGFQYTTSANFSAPLDWNRVTTTTTTTHPLATNLLTVPLNDWSAAALMENENNSNAGSPHIDFDANGNGIAVWTQASDVLVRRYLAGSGQWSAPVVLDANPNTPSMTRLAVDHATGNAIASWAQSDGVAVSLYVSSFNASNNSWSAAQLIETSNNAVTLNSSISISGEHAAISWLQSDGTPRDDVYLSRLVAGTWTARTLVDTGTETALTPEVAVDHNGNLTVAWRQLDPISNDFRINTRRWNNTTQAFGAVTPMNSSGDRQPRLRFDAQGNGFLLWRGVGTGGVVRRFDVATGQWSPEVQLRTGPTASGQHGELAVDASGDALGIWMEVVNGVNTIHARRYDVASDTWGAATPIASNQTPGPMTVALRGDSGVVTWITEAGPHDDVYGVRMHDGVWGNPALLETQTGRATEIATSIDPNNNATVLWVQIDDVAFSLYQSRSNGAAYYTVPAGATWQSLANTLYGVNSEAAANALQTALSSPTLSTGLHLQGLPATLVVTPTVPTHYVVQSGDTWATITLALYGTNRVEARNALWNQLGQPALVVGQSLYIPSELAYTIAE